jgi:hypothetical protein
MSHAANIRAALSLAHSLRNEPLSEGPANDLAQETVAVLRDLSLAWYYAHLDRRCSLSPAELYNLPGIYFG